MAKYKVVRRFRDKETQAVNSVSKDGESIEISDTRAEEINKAHKAGGPFVERVEAKEEKAPEVEEEKAPDKPKETKETKDSKDKK